MEALLKLNPKQRAALCEALEESLIVADDCNLTAREAIAQVVSALSETFEGIDHAFADAVGVPEAL